MDEKSRELLTGCALIALAIKSASNQLSAEIRYLARTQMRESQRHEFPRIEYPTRASMILDAVMFADACLVEMNIKTPDPFHNQDS